MMPAGFRRAIIGAVLWLVPFTAVAADYPVPKEATFIARDFRFHTGEAMPELKLHYVTVGEPTGQPVLLLHGTASSARSFLTAPFAGELFGAGQPLDVTKYFIIMPDAIGAGESSKPSDGLRAKFPRYNYNDMVAAQHRLVTEGLGIKHLRLVIGNSMGGMHVWLWGESYPQFMDALVPMASQPTEMAGRNWIMRRLLVEAVRSDPDWDSGDYTTQPKAFRLANAMFRVATSGGTLAYQKLAPTRETANKLAEDYLTAPFTADANDFMYQWDSSRDYDASPGLAKIEAALLAINAADDERNPPETLVVQRALTIVNNGKLYLIPASEDTRGHGTTGMAKFWKQQLQVFLQAAPRRAM
jgi:homoserine O-acetyltransferase